MTADLIERVRSQGANLFPLGQRLRVFHSERLDSATIDALRHSKPAVLRALAAALAAVAIVYECAARDSRRPPGRRPRVGKHEAAEIMEVERKPLNGKKRGRKPTRKGAP